MKAAGKTSESTVVLFPLTLQKRKIQAVSVINFINVARLHDKH